MPLRGRFRPRRPQARDVLAQIQGLDANLERAVDSYNLANEKLAGIESDLRENKQELRLAKSNLRHAQTMLNARLVELYTSGGGQDNGLEVLLGATSMDDLIARIDTMNRVSDQSTDVLQQVKTFRAKVKEQRARLQNGSRAAGKARRAALGGEGFDRGPARVAPAAPVLDQERDRPDAGRGGAAAGRARGAGAGAARVERRHGA